MNLPSKVVHMIAVNLWTVIISTVSVIIVTGYKIIYDRFYSETFAITPIISFMVITVLYTAISITAIRVISDNQKLKKVANDFREINSIYRDTLFSTFYRNSYPKERYKLIDIERTTVTSVCQRISRIFTRLTGVDCVVTVKFLIKEDNGSIFARTYTRSENDSERDKADPKKFKVAHRQNTAFDEALKPNTTGKIPHFYSGDLQKHKYYFNQRPNWNEYYQSAIIVPIFCSGVVHEKSERDDVGFLCVDTKSKNRLNNSHHVTMMAALADQMYNFMSLMRGKYTVSVE